MPDVDAPSVSNALLRRLPEPVLAALLPQLRLVELPLQAVLHEAGRVIDVVYFPQSGWLSLIAALKNGDSAEVGLIGKEGLLGLPVVLGTDRGPLDAYVQATGEALAMSAEAFRAALEAYRRCATRRCAMRWRSTCRCR